MSTATLTSKGQITIPVDRCAPPWAWRRAIRWNSWRSPPGVTRSWPRTGSVTALKGMFGPARRRVSIEDMNAAIARRGAAAMDYEP